MLLALPIPTLVSLQTPWRTKMRLYILCALGLFIIAVTAIRLPINTEHAAVQANRSIWASTELLTAAIVVNAPPLYGAFNNWRRGLKSGMYASNSHHVNSSHPFTVGSTARSKHSHRITNPSGVYDEGDDDELMLRAHCQTSVTSGSTTQEGQNQEGVILKTIKVSYDELGSANAAKPNSNS